MSKYFRPWNIDQTLLLPPHVQDFVPKGHVSRFIVELVRESLDLKEITGSYVSGLGQPPFEPRMMVALLLHGYPPRHGPAAASLRLHRTVPAVEGGAATVRPALGPRNQA